MANVQLVGAIIASTASVIVAAIVFIIYLRKEKTVQQKMIVGDLEIESYKDYDLLMVSGKQLRDFKKKILEGN